MKFGGGRPELGCRGFRRLEEVQEGWEKCSEPESKQSLGDVQGGFQKCREVSRSAGIGRPRGWIGCRQKCRELETVQGEGRPKLAEEPGRMQEQERSCKQGCSGSLGPYGCGPGPSIGLPAGEDGPKAAPNRKKSLGTQGRAPHLYTVGEEREGRTERETVGVGEDRRDKGEVGRTDRREQGQGLVKLPLPTLPFLPACPRPPLTA